MSRNLRQLSKDNFIPSSSSLEAINTGSLQRIADATEKMASNYQRMETDLKWYKEKYQEKNAEIQRLCKVVSGLKGRITRIKNNK